MPPSHRRSRLPRVGVVTLTTLTLAAAVPASAATAENGTSPTPPTAGAASSVTLLTGDRVTLRRTADSGQRLVAEPAAGRSGIFFVRSGTGERTQVVPSDALPLLRSGALDPRLFEVQRLLRNGYGDAARTTLPLIVRRTASARSTAFKAAGVESTRELPSINAVAVRAGKGRASQFWNSVTSAPAGRSRRLSAPVERIWLDGPVRGSLETSVPLIGAPKAWQAGHTGKGVTVAVLDTGYDPKHPDLKGVVSEARDFTGAKPDASDSNGHGTHVASTVAGSGAASNGKYKGVAPDAKLLVGKVLADDNVGEESWVIAGMEWAATRARVVNLSLSGGSPDDSDPMIQAANTLSARHGTLFTVAAGNTPGAGTIDSPAAAAAALAVGSVDRTGRMAPGSSHGPIAFTGRLKPDITAPGVDITAAAVIREGGSPYRMLSGTSMATPHVAGAAAILAQQHPDWNGEQLKAALTSSAKPSDAPAFTQGAGLLDVARADTARVTARTAGVDFGLFRWPHAQQTVRKPVVYHNDTDAPVRLELATRLIGPDGQPAPAGLFALSASQLTVPAHATATVELTAHLTAQTPPAAYSGRIIATGAGGELIQVPVGADVEPESYDLEFSVLDREGASSTSGAEQLSLYDARGQQVRLWQVGGKPAARLPKGRYSLYSVVATGPADRPESVTVLADPALLVTGDQRVVLDARAAKPLGAQTLDSPTAATGNRSVSLYQRFGGSVAEAIEAGVSNPSTKLFATPAKTDPGQDHTLVYLETKAEPAAGARSGQPPRGYHLAFLVPGGIPADPWFRVRDAELAQVDEHLRGQGTSVQGRLGGSLTMPSGSVRHSSLHKVTAPGQATELFSVGKGLTWEREACFDQLGCQRVKVGPGFRAGHRERGPDWNNGAVSPTGSAFWQRKLLFLLSPFAPGTQDSTVGGTSSADQIGTGTTTLTRDGKLVGTVNDVYQPVFEPADRQEATYQLTLKAGRATPRSTLASSVESVWTFRGAGPDGTGSVVLPLLNARVTGDFDALDRAPKGRPFPLQVWLESKGKQLTPEQTRSIGLEVSYDEGKTWSALRLSHFEGPYWTATGSAPADAGDFAALRVSAVDTAGSSVRHTTLRAYGLR